MKKSKLSLVAMIIGIVVAVQEIIEMQGFYNTSNGAALIGVSIAAQMIVPSIVCLALAVILNIIGWLLVNKTLTLISAIIYTLAVVVFPAWGFVAIPSAILQFIAFGILRKRSKKQYFMEGGCFEKG